MTKIKVIYVNKTADSIDDSLLDELIDKGEIAAFCGPHGWIPVTDGRLPAPPPERDEAKKRSGREAAGDI